MKVRSYVEAIESLLLFLSKARRNKSNFSVFLRPIKGGFELVGTASPGELSEYPFGIDSICLSREDGIRFQTEFGLKVRR